MKRTSSKSLMIQGRITRLQTRRNQIDKQLHKLETFIETWVPELSEYPALQDELTSLNSKLNKVDQEMFDLRMR